MCGICAIVGGRHESRSVESIAAMTRALRHRGPDAQTHQRIAGADLGHVRLSIIDLDTGQQPMADVSQRYWIVFNGELYNYRELREELTRLGYTFRTHSDTEVILIAYIAWGARCLDKFRGMYAFLIWDTLEVRAFAARDIFGEKPLYYATSAQGALVVASEIKSIIASRLIAPRLSRQGVDAYLSLGYVSPDRTVYENVHSLRPGHYLEWSPRGSPRQECYWSPRLAPRSISLEEAGEELRRLLDQAVKRQMVADVPLGAFLSGGHDSSTIVALMARHTSLPVKTFSVGFGEYINELPYAQAVAERYSTEHHSMNAGTPAVGDLLARMAQVYDEPFLDPSHIPTFLVAEYARRYVKVVLTGDGADELFGGYAWYPLLATSTAVSGSALAWMVSRGISRLLSDRFPALARYSQALSLARRWPDPWERYVKYRAAFSEAERASLWRERDPSMSLDTAYFQPPMSVRGMDRALHFDLLSFLPGDILVKVDRAAMAHGLETRAPFLDRDVVEFALSLPSEMKVTATQTKVLFKNALQRFWPKELHQRGKQGFAAPFLVWLQRADVDALVKKVFRRSSPLRELLPGITDAAASERSYRTWSLLTLGLWLEAHAIDVSAGDSGRDPVITLEGVASSARVVA